ncbi:MAG: hypothetical protein HW416_2302 [Chloroflexi bacterium]|nr:hypothetical protein [Chloroflexota bacterium]
MVLVLSNDDVASVLTMPACMEAIEDAYREQAAGRAVNQLRYDTRMPLPERQERDSDYEFKTMVGIIPKMGIAALRMSSTLNFHPLIDGVERSERLYLAPGGTTVGMVQLYSVETGEPLAFMPDGVLQGTRVGATYGIAAKHLARADATVMGLLGSGWQARFQVAATAQARPLQRVKVYSPNREHREQFAKEIGALYDLDVEAVESADEAARDVDILVAATNSRGPLIPRAFVKPGMHIAAVQNELAEDAYPAADLMVVASDARYLMYMGGGGAGQYGKQLGRERSAARESTSRVLIEDVVAGKAPGRTRPDEITMFRSDSGMGIQFAAAGAVVYQEARKRGLGHEIPTDWFTQSLHT